MTTPPDKSMNRLQARLAQGDDRPSRRGLSPAMSFGRHSGPPRSDARQAAVLVLLYPRNGRWHLPLTRRQDYLTQHAGQVSLPGGAIDPGESSQQAALRETHEELGIETGRVRILGQLTSVNLFNSNFHVTPWVGSRVDTPEFLPNPEEVAELIELPLSALRQGNQGLRMTIRRGRLEFSAPYLEWQGTKIWGATHLMLGELGRILDEIDLDSNLA